MSTDECFKAGRFPPPGQCVLKHEVLAELKKRGRVAPTGTGNVLKATLEGILHTQGARK